MKFTTFISYAMLGLGLAYALIGNEAASSVWFVGGMLHASIVDKED